MTRGTRSKGGGVSNKENNKTVTMNANNTDNSQRNAKAGGASKSRSKEKQRIVEEEITKSVVPALDETQTNDVSSTAKKEHHKQVQPTSTQIMLAQLMGGENMDSMQKVKIKIVMDITGKMEDAVATALFDASWDESRAVELLLEDGDHLTAWEETGKKGKKKQKQSADDKEETEDLDEYNGQDFRENSGKRGPQRVRRGGGTSQGGDRLSSKNRAGDSQFSNGSHEQGRDRDQGGSSSGRGRNDQHPRRGGRGGGAIGSGRSSYSGRGRRGGGSGVGREGVGSNGSGSASGNENVGGFSGSIDTWNPNGGSSGDGGSCSGGASSSSGGRAGHRSRGGHHGSSKDAFDNAGNWGDDFPAAEDWDNEEYTGSLADTKVFTASGQGGKKKQTTPHPHPKKQSSTVSGNLSSYASSQVAQANESALAAGGSSQSVGQQVVPPTPLSTTVGTATSTYSQSIDLSTLLHKPTTQSSVGSNSQQQTLLQFTQQATDSLKAAVGIGQQPTVGTTVAGGSSTGAGSKTGDLTYSSYASASAASASGGNSGTNPASGYGQGNSAFTSIKPSQQQSGASKQQQQQQGASANSAVAAAQHRSRLPPPSKIPNSAVEMPGDQLGRLDVQFGGLDLQFVGGGGSSANSDSVNSFEFNGTGPVSGTTGTGPSSSAGKEVENAYLSGDKSKVATGQSVSTSGSVKEVKNLSNAMGTGKLSSNDGYGNSPDGRKSGSGNNPSNTTSYSSSRGVDMSVNKQSESMTGYHGSTPQSSYSNYGSHSKSAYHHQISGYGSNQNNPYSGHQSYGGGNHPGGYGQSYSVSSTGAPSSNYGGNKASSNYPSNDAMVKGNFSNDQSIVNNAAAVLGLTSTTNALTGKVSATTASKVSVPNLPPGVANMLPQHYMAAAGLPAAAFYGLQQPAAAMYSACTGLEDLAAMQRASGLPALQPGYYDPNSQYAATSLAAAAASNRDGSTNLSSLGSTSVLTTSASSGTGGSVSNSGSTNTMSSSHNSNAGVGTNDKSMFGNVSANDSTSSPIPSSTHQQTLQQNAAATPATLNFAATNAFAAQHQQATLPPGYAYFYGQVPGLQAAYGGAGVYPATAMAVPTAAGGTTSTQFQKSAYGTSYGPGYDTLSQQGNKDYTHGYSGGSAVSGKNSGAGGNAGGAGHQYWGNNLNNPLW